MKADRCRQFIVSTLALLLLRFATCPSENPNATLDYFGREPERVRMHPFSFPLSPSTMNPMVFTTDHITHLLFFASLPSWQFFFSIISICLFRGQHFCLPGHLYINGYEIFLFGLKYIDALSSSFIWNLLFFLHTQCQREREREISIVIFKDNIIVSYCVWDGDM